MQAQRTKRRRQEQKLRWLVKRSEVQLDQVIKATQTQLAANAPEELAVAVQALQAAAGRKHADTVNAYKQRLQTGALPPPPRSIAGLPKQRGAPRATRRPAMAIRPGVVVDFNAMVADLVRKRPKRVGAALDALGRPSNTELAALLQRALQWAPLEKVGHKGQTYVLAGLFLERARKLTPAFKEAPDAADATRRAWNEAARKRRGTRTSADAETQALDSRDYGVPVFFEKVLDGDRKQLSDGMHISRDGKGDMLITMIDEVKKRRAASKAPAQQDNVIRRIRELGIILGSERIPPGRIRVPMRSGPPAARTELVGYLEGAAAGVVTTPAGYRMRVEHVAAPGLLELAEQLLREWNRRSGAPK